MNLTKVLQLTACTTIFCAGVVFAQEQGMLTQAQWSKRIGESAKNSADLTRNLKQVPQSDRVDFTRRTLKAVSKLPLGPKAKTARYTESTILCVAGAQGDTWYGVIAEGVALASVADLPVLVKEVSDRIDPKKHNMSAEQYKAVAEKGVDACIARNASADDSRVRNTFAILLFTQSVSDSSGLQESLVSKLPDDRSRELATVWLADAARGDYTAILAAADVQVASPKPAIGFEGRAELDRLLSYLGMMDSAFDAIVAANVTGSSLSTIDILIDAGFQQTPLGYQNQGTRIKPGQTIPIRP